ncbi:MAG: imidazoleglycerol-phosphate dehydratase [Candidatus Omnitrophica bacterium]|nr:imidazoleglycerol-phosphate dehydratase [Candidatus Omnitrophota bacterium]MCF7878416.1 imidazoleglycerol-phosphate dehydratase [Candidatus Omnitrophota bacterium]MCF7892939.1 imidazoleglycerol-phosphate dehydratase [Candidatus Omnitrophota bacterium]
MFNKKRQTQLKRKTNEVDILGRFNLDGAGNTTIDTGFEPLNHLLTLFAFHGFFDLELKAKGDLQHHIIEDIGIALGKGLKESLGDKQGINRYGSYSITMDKVAVEANIDISGRPSLLKKVCCGDKELVDTLLANGTFDDTGFNFSHAEEFLEAFIQHSGLSLVYIIKSGQGDLHHLLEALFKALGKSLDQASQIDSRRRGIPSTKGIID